MPSSNGCSGKPRCPLAALQRHPSSPRLCASRRDQRLRDICRRRNGSGCRPTYLRRTCTCCCRRSGFQPRRKSSDSLRSSPTAASIRMSCRTQLAEQVLAALYELLRGFQAADDQRQGELLREVLAEDPNHVYAGPAHRPHAARLHPVCRRPRPLIHDPVYANYYSVTGLFERLRADAGRISRHDESALRRLGTAPHALSADLRRAAATATFRFRPRQGYLFDPDRYPFLEGRP